MREHAADPQLRDYEMMLVVAPTVTEEGLQEVVDRISGYITTQNGTVDSTNSQNPWGRRRLAYQIQEHTDAFYVLYRFHATTGAIDEIERELRLDEQVIRHLIVRYDVLAEHEERPRGEGFRRGEAAPAPARAAAPAESAPASEAPAATPAEVAPSAAETAPAAASDVAATEPAAAKATATEEPAAEEPAAEEPATEEPAAEETAEAAAAEEPVAEQAAVVAEPETGSGSAASSGVEVAEVHHGADGHDHDGDEWVVIRNGSDAEVQLEGWKLADNGEKHTYVFPAFALPAGGTVRVVMGQGDDDESDLYVGKALRWWNNDGDCAYLYDASGTLVATHCYGNASAETA